jgi:VanZ family protein
MIALRDDPARHPRPRLRWLARGWAVLILVACWIPRAHLPPGERVPGVPNVDKVVHFGLFAVLGLLVRLSASPRTRTATLLALGLLLAIVSEVGQATPFVNRDANVPDGLADSLGMLAGLLAIALLPARTDRSGGAGS